VATRFFFVSGIPILPLDSWAVVERKELVSFGFLAETVTGLTLTSEGSAKGIRVPFSFKSVLLTYVRALLWIVHGIATAGLVILALGDLIDWCGFLRDLGSGLTHRRRFPPWLSTGLLLPLLGPL
jgi:hypothetical protein